MKCPRCSTKGLKNDGCMHVTCPCHPCRKRWCYCCGRLRNVGTAQEGVTTEVEDQEQYCQGCDAANMYLENQPDGSYSNFAIGSESAGDGALYEFHRRVIAYLVRCVKERTPNHQWLAFQSSYPNILTDVPTLGRRILWDELGTATPPCVGNSRPEHLLWTKDLPFLPDGTETVAAFRPESDIPPLYDWIQKFGYRQHAALIGFFLLTFIFYVVPVWA